jgi:hypothetical protein
MRSGPMLTVSSVEDTMSMNRHVTSRRSARSSITRRIVALVHGARKAEMDAALV